LGLGAIADFGILDSTVRYVSKYYSFGDEPAVVRTIRSAASVCAIVGLVGVGILAASASFIARYLLHIPSVEQHIAAAAIQLSGLYFLFGFINAGLRSALRGCHRFDLDAKLDIAFEVVTTLTNVALAYGGAGLLAVLTNMTLWSLVAACATAVTLRRTAVK